MIAVDTNVLLRYLLQDDKAQSPRAVKLLTGSDKVLITDVVMVETIWTLKGKKYKLTKEDLIKVAEQLFQEPNIEFEDGQTMWRALSDFRTTLPPVEVDFADTLILAKAQFDMRIKVEKFNGLYTFDVALQHFTETKKP